MTIAQPWPFSPEWTSPIIEGLEWLTAIQTSKSGAEQRQALRITPRRRFDIPFQLVGQERSYFDMLMAQLGGKQWYVPIPHEEIHLEGVFLSGTSVLTFDTTFREFRVGGRIIVRESAFNLEVVLITEVTSTHISVFGLVNDYLNGVTITPAFVGMITDKVVTLRKTARVLTGTARFYAVEPTVWPMSDRASDYSSFSGLSAIGYPVLTQEPNAINDLDYTYERLLETVDNSTAIPRYVDRANRMFMSQKYEWFLYGRKENQDFRDLMFALQGRLLPLWVPTFNDDIVYGKGFPDPQHFATAIVPDREYQIYFNRDGSFGTVSNARAAELPGENYDGSPARQIAFLTLKRLDVDTIELSHEAGVDGVTTVSAIFRDAPDLRFADTYRTVLPWHSGYVRSGGTDPATNDVVIGLTDVETVVAYAPYVPPGGTP